MGFNYRRSTSHGAQNLHKGEDVVPTGPDSGPNAIYPKGVVGMPIKSIFRGRLIKNYPTVGGYHHAALFEALDFDADVLIGHILQGSVLVEPGEIFEVGTPIVRMGDRCDADPGGGCNVDAHIHVQAARKAHRASYINVLGAAFNNVAIDPRALRIAMGEPDMPAVRYFGPLGPKDALRAGAPSSMPELDFWSCPGEVGAD